MPKMDNKNKKRPISFTRPEDPSFLKKIKAQIGYKEGPNIDTKREDLPLNEDLNEKEDERPTVVVLRDGDISQEEAEILNVFEDQNAKDEEEVGKDGKIVFKKPIKKAEGGEGEALDLSTTTTIDKDKLDKSKKESRSTMKQVKNKSLLSFDDEENDDDED